MRQCCKNKEFWHLKASLNDIWPFFRIKKCMRVYDRGVNIRINTVPTKIMKLNDDSFFEKANTCLQFSSFLGVDKHLHLEYAG